MTNRDIEKEVIGLVERVAGLKPVITMKSRLFQDLGIAGDDAWELLKLITQRFNTEFSNFPWADYFPDETEAFWAGWGRRLGLGKQRWKPLPVNHLVKVVEQGKWFEPHA